MMRTVEKIEPKNSLIPHKKRVAAYARVSLEKEMMLHSFSNQVQYYNQKISLNPMWINAGVYSDYGITGTKKERPGFQKLLQACDEGKVDIILVKSISRFCRNTVDLLNITRKLREKDIHVVFEKENIDSATEDGEFLLSIIAACAQEESRSISENVKWAFRKGFEKGFVNRFIIYGYKWTGSEFVVNPEQAEIVKEVFRRYLDGEGPCGISADLRRRNIKSLENKPFYESHIHRMLRNEKYTGNSLLQKTYRENHITKRRMVNNGELPMFFAEGTHPIIIEQSVFDAVQNEFLRREELGFKANKKLNINPFTHLVRCSECGRTYRRTQKQDSKGKKSYIWRCGTKAEHRGLKCYNPNIAEDVLYSLTAEVLGGEVTSETVSSVISEITVMPTHFLMFKLKDGNVIEKKWKLRCSNAKYMEAKYADC